MSPLNKDLVLLILQFIDEEGFKEAARVLERESGCYFNMKFIEDMILSGNWDEAERYISGFTKFDDNRYSMKIYFEIKKQKFLEALDNHDRSKALDILIKDLKVFAPDNEDLFKEMTLLLTLNDIRENESLSLYSNAESARKVTMVELRKVIEANPLLRDKLEFPSVNSQRLRRLINQSLNWQHMHCTYPQPDPDIRTLFVDHVCVPIPPGENYPLPYQTTSMPVPTSSASKSQSTETHSSISTEAFSLADPTSIAAITECLENNSIERSAPSDLDQSFVNISDNLPKNVARILNEGSSQTSMDFHPVQQTVLLVGTIVGDIGLWEVSSGKSLLSRNFKVWDIGACSILLKVNLLKNPSVSVNRVAWSPEGSSFGVAFSKHIVQIYSYSGANNVQQQLEIDAHVGGVNDLAFSAPKGKLLVITCGDDKTVKAWDAITGVKMYTFEGHDAPVYSLCPHSKGSIHFILSTSVNGNIKVWLYDNTRARVDYGAPGLGHTSMAYSGDGRLFSCGTSKSGESFLVEWDDTEGSIKRTYLGLQKNSSGVVQFDILKNQVLAVGDEHAVKIWDMNNVELFTTIDAEGGLPANPCVRFSKEGSLLAVSANDNKIKILATDSCPQLLCASENCSGDASEVLSDTFKKLAIGPTSTVACAGVTDEAVPKTGNLENLDVVKSKFPFKAIKSKSCNFFGINSTQCQILRLPSHAEVNKISRLIYNNTGNAILALASNATHLYWKWPENDFDSSGKATAKVCPQLWQPRSCLGLMTNDPAATSPEEAMPCFALSKNDSYLLSASGGSISLFNLLTFKKMLSVLPPPPAATCIAFYPQDNNIISIGRDNSTILIYNVRLSKVISMLEGHSKRVSGLAFSTAMNVLVSSGADAQLFVWNTEGWGKLRSRILQIPDGKRSAALTDTHIQFHANQTHLLAVHETHLSIYDARNLECVQQWIPGHFTAPISHATFSCDSQNVYTGFADGTLSILGASNFQLHYRIFPASYLPPTSSLKAYPVVVAEHPRKPNQFAVGMTDGGVIIFEPPNSAGQWSTLTADDNGSASKVTVEPEVVCL